MYVSLVIQATKDLFITLYRSIQFLDLLSVYGKQGTCTLSLFFWCGDPNLELHGFLTTLSKLGSTVARHIHSKQHESHLF